MQGFKEDNKNENTVECEQIQIVFYTLSTDEAEAKGNISMYRTVLHKLRFMKKTNSTHKLQRTEVSCSQKITSSGVNAASLYFTQFCLGLHLISF